MGVKMKRTAATASIALLLLGGAAAARAAEVRPMIKAAADFGGDTLVTVVFTDGSRQSIKANELLSIGGGVSIVNDTGDIETELTLSYKFATVTASNGDVTFSRFPLDALVLYRLPQLRLGGGLTYHLGPKLSGSGVASGLNANFDDALGLLLQADYRVTPKINLGIRYTSLDYKLRVGGASATARSNGVGIVFSASF
jgi:hypothetical protein